jgi:hypothetical protein
MGGRLGARQTRVAAAADTAGSGDDRIRQNNRGSTPMRVLRGA